MIAAGGNNPEWVRAEIRKCRELTSGWFGVNIMLMSPHASAIAEVVIEEKVPVVITGAGNPGPYVEGWKRAGIVVIPVIASVALAKRMERAGVDAVIAEGTEAGGRRRNSRRWPSFRRWLTPWAFPSSPRAESLTKRGVVAAFVLGAKGVQLGTVLLASEECPVHPNYKQKILEAKDTDTVVTGRRTKAPVRVLKNPMAREYLRLSESGVSLEELEKMTLGSLRKAVLDGDLENGSFMAGQISGSGERNKTRQENL